MPKLAAESEDQQKRGSMDVLYNSDEFRMYCFKVLPCSKHYSHDWTICPFAHPGEKARRRDPRVFKYAGVECPHVKEGLKCPRGDLCPFAHNIFECWLHPTRYRTQLCNEPASCKRKVCFFAHALEELREPCNPVDNIPEGGIGSGTAPLMSLDGLGTSGAFAGMLPLQRQSIDVGSLHQMGMGTSSPLNMHELVAGMQGLGIQHHAQQNQQLTNLLINLLAEIDLNGQRQALMKSHQHQQQQLHSDPAFFSNTLGGLPRWSTDSAMLSTAQFPSLAGNFQAPSMVPGVMPSLSRAQDAMFNNRSASMESSIHDAMTQGMQCHGRVSIDNSALTRAAISVPHTLHPSALRQATFVNKRDSVKLNFRSIDEDQPVRSSEEESSGTSTAGFSADSSGAESYPMSYPLEDTDGRASLDCTLPEPFILF